MDNTMQVNVTENQKELTKEAFMSFSYGGKVEVETSPNVWVRITTPLELMRDTDNFDISKLKHNYRIQDKY